MTEDRVEEPSADVTATRCGFAALVGVPNAGKSTLLNALIGAKVSIVSPKAQTTRSRVLGIATEGAAQIVFVDTPGIFEPKRRMERAMVAAAWQGAGDADEVVVLVDAARKAAAGQAQPIIERLRQAGRKAVLALNKIDLIRRDRLLGLADSLHREGLFTDIFMISATTGDGVADLRAALGARLPLSPWLYPDDQLSDIPMRLLAAELVREQLFNQLHDELPYSTTVEPEQWQEFENGSARVACQIFVERESQRAIVLGKAGARIKSVGQAARRELEAMLERPVHLMLHVKVREDWTEDRERYRDWGLDYDA